MPMKRLGLLALMLLLLPLAHLRPCCQVTVDGRTLEGRYTPAELKQAARLARETAEELLEQEAAEPRYTHRCRLSLRPADGDLRLLSDALIRSYPEITLADGVFVNGVQLGTVDSGAELYQHLRGSILAQMPNTAVFGNISGQLRIRPVYSRLGHETDCEDMVLRVFGTAPALYLDEEGRLA